MVLGLLCLTAASPQSLLRNTCVYPRAQYPYAITFKGPDALWGFNVHRFRAFSRQGRTWREVPVQVDEVNTRGDYVLAEGLPYTKASDDGVFDDNDELVLRGTDFGDDFAGTDIPKDVVAGSLKLWKASICDRGNDFGTILLINGYSQVPRVRFNDVVTFDQASQEIRSAFYRYKFRRDEAALLGDVALIDGNQEHRVFADSAFKMILRLPWYLPDFTWTRENFVSTIESWQVGPIRAIVAVGVKLRNFLKLFNFHMFSELVFYDRRFHIPTVIEFTFDPSRYLKPGSGLAYAITYAPGTAWELNTNLVDLPAQSADALVEGKQRAADFPRFYASGKGTYGSFSVTVRVDKKAATLVPPPFIMRGPMFQSEALRAYWPWLLGLQGDLGVFVDISNVRKGTYDFGLDLVLSSKADQSPPAVYDALQTSWTVLPDDVER